MANLKFTALLVGSIVLFAYGCVTFLNGITDKQLAEQNRARVANVDFCSKLSTTQDQFACLSKFYVEGK